MKTCEAYREMISRLLDEDLSAEERSELERHAASCPDCAAVLAAFRSLSEALADDPAEPPEGLHENIMADVRREAIRRRQAPKRVRSFLALAACAALVILAAANLPRMGSSGPKLAAAPAAARDESYAAVEYAEAEESVDAAAPAAAPADERPAGAVYAGGSAEMPAEAPAPMPEPEAPAAMQDDNDVPFVGDAVQTDSTADGGLNDAPAAENAHAPEPAPEEAQTARIWPYVLVGLLAVGGALLLLRRPKRK